MHPMRPATTPDTEPYPDELEKLRLAHERLSAKFAYTPLTDANLHQFLRAAADLFGEAGFTVDVGLDEVRNNGVPTGWYMPEVTITGRLHKEAETDHERVAWGVREGLVDGVKGVIRADGTKTEEPRKKLIY